MVNYVEANVTDWEQKVTKSEMLTVVHFWHDECPWCLRLNPIFSEVTEEFRDKIKFVKFNILAHEANRQVASNYGVMSTPTLAFSAMGVHSGKRWVSCPKNNSKKSSTICCKDTRHVSCRALSWDPSTSCKHAVP